MKVTICIGSTCHVKGAGKIVEQLQSLIAQKNCGDKVELSGAFCMGKCATGVSVTVDGKYYSLQPENTKAFFEEQVVKTRRGKERPSVPRCDNDGETC